MTTNITNFNAEGSIASLAPTVARLFSAVTPALASESPIESVLEMHKRVVCGEPIERCLIFCPDALGVHIWRSCMRHLDTITELAELRVPLLSVMPPKTPVCFASIFTGAKPIEHGILKYERPVLRCETLFDVLLRANQSIAIVSVRNCSIDLIFRERNIEYFSEQYDEDVLLRAIGLVKENRHNLIIVYQQEYDDLLHKNDPFSELCVQAVTNHVNSFVIIARTAMNEWNRHNNAIIFAPDHGAHIDSASGHGDHGVNIPDDMQLFHWYGINRACTKAG
jgi:predicted AlkP superfamily pyrophosphatase or phosphodiesterase